MEIRQADLEKIQTYRENGGGFVMGSLFLGREAEREHPVSSDSWGDLTPEEEERILSNFEFSSFREPAE